MKKYTSVIIQCFVLLLIVGVIIRESAFHFSRDLVEKKWEHSSGQRHWSIWYSRKYVHYNSPFRYQADINSMKDIIIPGYSVLSDSVTSYYVAAMLPVYVGNIQIHHGVKKIWGMQKLRPYQALCYLEYEEPFQNVVEFFRKSSLISRKNGWPEFRYIILNKDKQNSMLRKECMAVLSHRLELTLLNISQLLYEGKYLNLYEVNGFSVKPPLPKSLSPQLSLILKD